MSRIALLFCLVLAVSITEKSLVAGQSYTIKFTDTQVFPHYENGPFSISAYGVVGPNTVRFSPLVSGMAGCCT